MKPFDYDRWPRRELFEFFSAMSQPFYSVSFRVEVTRLYDYVKPRGLSFYYALIYLCTKAINSVEAFRIAIEGGAPVLLEERAPSFTDLKKGAESFHIVSWVRLRTSAAPPPRKAAAGRASLTPPPRAPRLYTSPACRGWI